jgi:hypothetical protein
MCDGGRVSEGAVRGGGEERRKGRKREASFIQCPY